MAVVEELGIILEADPTGLEEGLDRANQKTKEFEENQQAASLATLENIARQEALVSSLNQISGGFAKTTSILSLSSKSIIFSVKVFVFVILGDSIPCRIIFMMPIM